MYMTYYHKTAPLVVPPSLAIPAGKYIDIDEKFFTKTAIKRDDGILHHSGSNINYQPSEFVKQSPAVIALETGSLKVNYGSYAYNQVVGWDDAHSPHASSKVENTRVFL
tara:strand:+ start:2426 stop:2752 length:327 start_codon:yes stop_codon:yes gene_type:complete